MKKKIYQFLLKWDMLFHSVFSLAMTFFGGLHFCNIEDKYREDAGFIDAFLNAGFTVELFLAVLIFFLSLIYDNYITKKSVHDIRNNKETIINNLLSSFTRAIFSAYENQVDVGAVVQVCDYRSKTRKIQYQYNINTTNSRVMGLEFGDVGEQCVKGQATLKKQLTREDWEQGDKNYQNIVPETLRYIHAVPIIVDEKVVAVLEINIFESTDESRRGGTKPNYATNDIEVRKIADHLNMRKTTIMLSEWINAISVLMEE